MIDLLSGSTNRRDFIKSAIGVGLGVSLVSPFDLFAASPPVAPISFYHTHTNETFSIKLRGGICSPEDHCDLNRFLRDHRTGEIHPIDIELIKLLSDIKQITKSSGTFEVISGYRSAATNAKLRSKSSGVAKKSMHSYGKAIDIRLTDVPSKQVRDVAIRLKGGGVGYYSKSDFVHVDTGRVRTW